MTGPHPNHTIRQRADLLVALARHAAAAAPDAREAAYLGLVRVAVDIAAAPEWSGDDQLGAVGVQFNAVADGDGTALFALLNGVTAEPCSDGLGDPAHPPASTGGLCADCHAAAEAREPARVGDHISVTAGGDDDIGALAVALGYPRAAAETAAV
jgi:hypothetical protein